MDESSNPPDAAPPGLLLSRDLIFTAKVTGTAGALGRRVLVAGGAEAAADLIGRRKPRVIFVDLAAGDLVEPAALASLQRLAGPETPFVAFGSHVDTAALEAARAAGCAVVLPRSRFSAELPALIRQYLPEAEEGGGVTPR
jgi:DNA-binding NarL/FixJ family response regulator